MSGEKLEEQFVNSRYKTNKKARGQSFVSFSQCRVCFGAFMENWFLLYLQIGHTKWFE